MGGGADSARAWLEAHIILWASRRYPLHLPRRPATGI